MIKKGLTRTLILEFTNSRKLTQIQPILDNLPELYKFLKKHPENPLTSSCSYDIFLQGAIRGTEIAQMKQMFRR